MKKIFISSDHAGYNLKKNIIKKFSKKQKIVDLGPSSNNSVDYPAFAHKLSKKVATNKGSFGILICGSGIGMSIAANRDKNIRAGLAFKSEIAKLMREHNDANVLILPGRFMNIHDAIKCVRNFLTTNFEGKRHQNRVNKLS